MANDPLGAALAAVVGEVGLRTEPEDLEFYGADRCRGGWPVAPRIVVLPATVSEVVGVVRACGAHGAAIVPSGGRTGLAGAATATAGEVVLSLERMHRVFEVQSEARILRCEAGATVEAVQAAAAAQGLLYPVDFASKGSAHIGGSIATNAGGVKVLRYGHTRAWVAGLRVVVASGEVLDIGGSLVKDNTGYDLRQLFIGSEGTLGVIVEATLRLTAPPRGEVVALCAVPNDDALLALFASVQAALPLMAFEMFDQGCLRHVLAHRGRTDRGPFATPSPQHALIEVEVTAADESLTMEAVTDCLADAQTAGAITDAVIAATPAQARELWSYREDISESLHQHSPHKADITLPIATLPQFIPKWRALVAQRLPEAEAVLLGHFGDGNLHPNVLKPDALSLQDFVARCHGIDDEMYELVETMHGSISAEHGIGLLKRDYLKHSRAPAEIAMMRAIKGALDPVGLFNPGKIFR